MTNPKVSAGKAAADAEQTDELAIRNRVRELTSQMLAGGRLDTESVKEVVRTMSGGVSKPAFESSQARADFAEAIRGLDAALHASALATHSALQSIVAHGKDFSDNDLKNAFAVLQNLQKDYVAVANRIADATGGNIQRELSDLALQAQRVGADVNVRFAQVLSEFANSITSYRPAALPGFDAMRQYGANMSMVTSALLAGFADALRQQSENKKAQ